MYNRGVPTVLQVSVEPGVIDRDMLISLVIEQGPKGESGRLFTGDGIKLSDTKQIRIEFLNILKIDCMWIMPNLVTMKLCNNIIEKIENLDGLVHLRELDLSFNRIRVMENLSSLRNLEVLLLYGNEISKLEGIDDLMELSVLSIGNNNIADWNHPMYLRKFQKLRSLNMERNPCTEQNGYLHYLLAHVPQLVYYQYQMITVEERKAATERYYREISYIQEREAKEKQELNAQQRFQEKVTLLSLSYVEHLDDDAFFCRLFEYDKVGRDLSAINEDTQNAFEEYRKRLSTICHDLYDLGLKEQCKRTNEIESLISAVNEEKEITRRNAQAITGKLVKRKTEIANEVKELIKVMQDDVEIDMRQEKIERARHLSEEFNDLSSKTWSELMSAEVALHDQIEDANEVFKMNISEMVNTFLEAAQDYFSLMRNAEAEYNDGINAAVLYFLSGFGDDVKLPKHLSDLCGDKHMLGNNLAASHDAHLRAIDAREDGMLIGLRAWLETCIIEQTKRESERNRHQILEISHFFDCQKEEFNSLDPLRQLQLSGIGGLDEDVV